MNHALERLRAAGWLDERTEEESIIWTRKLLGYDEIERLAPLGLEFYGQKVAMGQIAPFVSRAAPFPNTLILGEPGIGKTRLARWIADQRTEPFEELMAPAKPEDFPTYGIVLLDEVHRQARPEWLFPIMENATVTILGATTRPEQLEPAFASRFFLRLHLARYEETAMIEMASGLLDDATPETLATYAGASAGNPRQLERIVAVAKEVGVNETEQVLAACRINGDGLTDIHLKLLGTLRKGNRPMGLGTLAVMLYLDEETVRQHERLLIEYDLVELRPNGRFITRAGKRYMVALEQDR